MYEQPNKSPFIIIITFSVVMFILLYIYFLWVRAKYVPVVNLIRARQAVLAINVDTPGFMTKDSPPKNPNEVWLTDNKYVTKGTKVFKDGIIYYDYTSGDKYYDKKGGSVYVREVHTNQMFEIFNSFYVRIAVINIAEDPSGYFDTNNKLSSLPKFYWSLSNIMSF